MGITGKYFCSKPFEWLELSINRKFYLCCPNWLPKNIPVQGQVRDAWNSKTAQEIRESILEGSFKFCAGCPYLEEKTGPVLPLDSVVDTRLKDIIKNRKAILDRGPVWLNLSHDPSCNLMCPSCRRGIIRIKGEKFLANKEIQEKTLGDLKDDLEWLYITGSGDPFGSELFHGLLMGLKEKEYPRLNIHLHSNGQLFDARRWDTIAGINSRVKWVHISIDAAAEATYLLNRKSNWKRLKKNLEFISRLRRTGPVETFEISMVVQQNNWREMTAFIDLGREFKVDRVLFTNLLNWGTFSKKEYMKRAVHLESHSEHRELTDFLKNEASSSLSPTDITVRWGPFAKYLDRE